MTGNTKDGEASPEYESLLPQHKKVLEDQSGIAKSVIISRGYRSVTTKAELKRIGFSVSQQYVPTLVLPVWSVLGEVRQYQHRPDTPRLRAGKPIKYETMVGKSMVLDVHPNVRADMGDPSISLFITEGIKKADAAITWGLCCIALLGVWNFRGTNEYGGKTALPDWEHIALNNRQVYLCFDSDVMEKKEVSAALVRLKKFLQHRGAKVLIIYLPHGDGGRKMGMDDFFAKGHTQEDLLALATPDLRKSPHQEDDATCPYRETSNGLVQAREGRDGEYYLPLTNFCATITAQVDEDDGADKARVFDIEARFKGKVLTFRVPRENFFAVKNWALQYIGAGAIVYPGQNCEANAATAIQSLSGDVPETRVYKHTGWRETEPGRWSYLNAGNVLGEAEPGTVSVQLASPLDQFCLPEPPESMQAIDAVWASLQLLELGPDALTVPIYASIWRAVTGPADFAVFVTGQSGVFKSEIAALAQQHFGAEMNSRSLPASWEATENYLEGLAFAAKDALLVIDDYAPRGGQHEQARLAAKADRVLRAQGNHSARGRLNANLTTRPSRPPRGIILSTGEDIPSGHSLRARNLILEVGKGEIDDQKLTLCQQNAQAGVYSVVMSAFLVWLAPQYESLQTKRGIRVSHLREQARKEASSHARTPEIIANLAFGMETFFEFAKAIGAVSATQKEAMLERTWLALTAVAKQQGRHLADSEPVQRYLELLRSALASGAAHVAGSGGDEPADAQAWGWRSHTIGAGEFVRDEWRAQGSRIGWVDGTNLYLEPTAAYQVAKRLGESSGDGIAIGQKTLNRLMKERGLLLSHEENRGAVARRELQGFRRDVLHLNAETLLGTGTDQSAQISQVEPKPQRTNNEAQSNSLLHNAASKVTTLGNSTQKRHSSIQPSERNISDAPSGQFGQFSAGAKNIPDLTEWDTINREERVV